MKGTSTGQPEEWPDIFLDRNFSSKLVTEILRGGSLVVDKGIQVFVHNELWPHYDFSKEESDVEWIERAGAEGWMILSLDLSIRTNGLEKQAVKDNHARMYAFTSKGHTAKSRSEFVISVLPRLFLHFQDHLAPYIARVYNDRTLKYISLE